MRPHLRFARPVADPSRSAGMYCAAFGMEVLGGFTDHDGFDGVMVGHRGHSVHFEFTRDRTNPIRPTPTPEDLVVFYVPEQHPWQRQCDAMLTAGFVEVAPHNPYWARRGRTFQDGDGYLVVIQRASWPERSAA